MRQGTARCRIHVRQRVIAVAFGVMVFGACSGAREQTVAMPVAPVQAQQAPAPVQASFSVSLVPTVPLPIRVGTNLGFNVSANTAGYASLYLIDPAGQVTVLGENMVVSAALDLVYPSPADGFTLAAAQPVGYNRVILLVTRQPFVNGFSGFDTLTTPVSLALSAGEFRRELNRRTAARPRTSWALDEIQVRVVG